MDSEHDLYFAPFRLDLVNEQLWLHTQEIPLRQKTFAVLRYLLEHAQQLVTKEALLDAVWAETTVSDIAPGVCVQELRRALGDDRQTPRFIVTVHRRGYRFIGEVVSRKDTKQGARSKEQGADLSLSSPAPNTRRPAPVLVGRDAELAQLHTWVAKALNGERQIVFVTGEPGIGKSMLVEAFLAGSREQGAESTEQRAKSREHGATISTSSSAPSSLLSASCFAYGQCIEQYGPGEPYMPILEALGRLCREPEGEQLVRLLRHHAPTWLVQMPTLLPAAELEVLQRQTQGVTRERMLREMGEAITILTAERPLVLILEDLHWSDASTLELLALLARRQEPARLLIVSTYRPVEMLTEHHPLKPLTNDLYAQQRAHELRVTRLNEAEVGDYLALRFPQSVFPTRLAQVLYRRSEGNPLFLLAMMQELIQSAMLVQADDGVWAMLGEIAELETWTPESVQQVLTRQRDRLGSEDQRMLAAASLTGVEFSAAAVAAALETETIGVEEHCNRLVEQQQFLRRAGVSDWPDGTRAARYGFLHALYQEFWHQWVSVGQRQQWHLRIGERIEHAYGKQAKEIAAELAVHFEQGRDYPRAIRYLQQSSKNAFRRSANAEAVDLLTKALDLLKSTPDTPERMRQELELQITLGLTLVVTKNSTAPEGQKVYDRALELSTKIEETPRLFPILQKFYTYTLARPEYQKACEVADRLLRLAASLNNPGLLGEMHIAQAIPLFYLGEFALARTHAEQGLALYDFHPGPSHTWLGGHPGIQGISFASWPLWFLGYPEQALKRTQTTLTLAKQIAHPHGIALALYQIAQLHQFRRDAHVTWALTEENLALSTAQGFVYFVMLGTLLQGCALTELGDSEAGLIQMERELTAWKAMGGTLGYAYFLPLLADAYGKGGQPEQGLEILTEALSLIEKNEERFYEAELYRIKGELTLQQESKEQRAQSKNLRSQILEPKSQIPHPRRRSVSSKPSKSLRSSKPSHWNCVPR